MYQIKVRVNDASEWASPMFPKCSSDLDIARRDAHDMARVYDHVAIIEGDEIIEEVNVGDSE